MSTLVPLVFRLLVVICLLSTLQGCVRASSNNVIVPRALGNAAESLPSVELSDLNGTDYQFPRDLPDGRTLLVFGFAHAQKELVQQWVDAVTGLPTPNENFTVFKVPVIDNSNAALRMIIRNGMRAGTTGDEAKEHTLPLFVDKSSLLSALGVPNADEPAAILFDREGRVLWKGFGTISPEKLGDLRATLSQPAVQS